uniref:hypothetical protein n=1 Tax=uncultured Ruegeria sp. TaxID=259304 RepID=UPI00262F36AF
SGFGRLFAIRGPPFPKHSGGPVQLGKLTASTVSLFAYLVPILVTVEGVALRGMGFQVYQGVGGVLIIGGVLIATRFHLRPTATDHPLH